MDYTHHYASPLGGITLACDGEALTGLWFDGQKYFAETLDPAHEEKDLPVFGEAKRWLDLYFSGRDPGFTPKLRLRGTAFRKAVWETLLTVPYGKTAAYGEIAHRAAELIRVSRTSARAVGGAVGRNPVSLIVPCHRIVGADGSLTGYAGGIRRKLMLLELEKADLSGLFVPPSARGESPGSPTPDKTREDRRMLYLKAANTADSEQEWLFVRDMPPDENGLVNEWYQVSRETFESEALPRMIAFAEGKDLPAGYVPETFLFLWDGGRIVGQFRIRHFLCESLRTGAGHIGYCVGKGDRGKGYGTEGLRLTLEAAREIVPEDEFYLRVNRDNPASLRVMLKNGGRIVSEDADKLYVRIPNPGKRRKT